MGAPALVSEVHGNGVNPPGATPLLEARNVTVRFGGLAALDGVSMRVADGEILGIVGPNGAGKTTLFHVLSGLQRPTKGEVYVRGRRITGRSPQDRAARGLLRTFQRVQLFPELTVREHLELAYRTRYVKQSYFRDLLGLGRGGGDSERDWIDQLIDRLALRDIEHQPAAALPLGKARLVEVGRALAARPSVVLLDEPSSGLDTRETQDLAEVLVRAREQEGVALVLVEHDLELVLGLSDRIDVLDFGQLIASGTPSEVRADPKVQAAYIGTERT
jgi:ABC-type branched-subunit amino acid transport system ATPase component